MSFHLILQCFPNFPAFWCIAFHKSFEIFKKPSYGEFLRNKLLAFSIVSNNFFVV